MINRKACVRASQDSDGRGPENWRASAAPLNESGPEPLVLALPILNEKMVQGLKKAREASAAEIEVTTGANSRCNDDSAGRVVTSVLFKTDRQGGRGRRA